MEMLTCRKHPLSHIWLGKHWNVNGFIRYERKTVWKRAQIWTIMAGWTSKKQFYWTDCCSWPQAGPPGGERSVNKQDRRLGVLSNKCSLLEEGDKRLLFGHVGAQLKYKQPLLVCQNEEKSILHFFCSQFGVIKGTGSQVRPLPGPRARCCSQSQRV